ncbi:MAG TPA: exodeoxyribonuclease VII small subunit [Bacilli bacterium]|nr:exodeoxyribonuclease VII small subunit [Bacilli bacterium]
MKFEEKMQKLENIIEDLEKDEVNLDDSINKYTEAMKLIKDCDKSLKTAEDKIAKIIKEDGSLENFELDNE